MNRRLNLSSGIILAQLLKAEAPMRNSQIINSFDESNDYASVFSISAPAIFMACTSLEKKGFIQGKKSAIKEEKARKRGEGVQKRKTLHYSITVKGEVYVKDWIKASIADPEVPLVVCAYFDSYLDRGEWRKAYKKRKRILTKALTVVEAKCAKVTCEKVTFFLECQQATIATQLSNMAKYLKEHKE